ncbi:MAG TPA: anti-sigma regulatory factor [Bryobacteraceae bacterium]|jgi:serine/threonine-protein kinase RsbT|nr:anti-sigma regulatory factor [Bryobacteraceae bacterium]
MAPKTDRIPLLTSEDIVNVRQMVRSIAVELGFSLVDQTKFVTAASEIARNTVIYGGGGWASIEIIAREGRKGLRVTFEDQGPGIADIDQALKDGFTTGSGLGLGLGGAKRLVNDFNIESKPGLGTRITIARWKS